MINPDALDCFRRARVAEENGDLEEAEMLDQQYRQLLREPGPAEQPELPSRMPERAAR